MSKFEIFSPSHLNGEIAVLGAKNVALKLIAAAVMIKDKIVLTNVPDILDIANMLEILKKNGAKIERIGHSLMIDTTNLSQDNPDPVLMEKLRASVVLIGPYLARFHSVNIPRPGGCSIGTRPIDVHLDAFTQMDIKISHKDGLSKKSDNLYHFSCDEFFGHSVELKFPSCTATENLIMLAALSSGKTTISNAAREPQIEDLANFLNTAGASITGAGTSVIEIIGVENLHGLNYDIMPDPIEAGTFVCLAVAANQKIKITHCDPDDLRPFLDKMSEAGANFEIGEDYILVEPTTNLKTVNFETAVYPGFPTDLQAPMGLVLTQAIGESHIKENIFENRLGYLKELQKMGARIEILSQNEAKITGPTPLAGADIESLDLRAGATVLLAGLIAQGKTIIENAEMIDRGYENIEKRLSALGANIKRIS